MSNYLAVATVTATLSNLLRTAYLKMEPPIPNAEIKWVKPGGPVINPSFVGTNIYLYQVTPNIAFRNADLPTYGANGMLLKKPLVALDLHYLLTFYGGTDDAELQTQRLLGCAMTAINAQPILSRREILETIHQFHFLKNSDLAAQVESVKFTPVTLSLEDLSKIWTVFFQVAHTLSTAYLASLVLLDSEVTPMTPLPVQSGKLKGGPSGFTPAIDRIYAAGGPNRPIVPKSKIVIQGKHLNGPNLDLVAQDIHFTPDKVSDTELLATLPEGLWPGVQGLQVGHQYPRYRVESQVQSFVLKPSVKSVRFTPHPGPQPVQGKVVLHLSAPVGPTQRITLILNQLEDDAPAAYNFAARREVKDGEKIVAEIQAVEKGKYLVRVQVDGAESPLEMSPQGNPPHYAKPRVVIEE